MWPKKKSKPFMGELRKDCFYIIMLPAEQREEFIKALEALDLSEGPEILVLDEMHLTVAEFSREDKTTHVKYKSESAFRKPALGGVPAA